jgi:hypothetical protein
LDLKVTELQLNFERMIIRLNEIEKEMTKTSKQEKKSNSPLAQKTHLTHESVFKTLTFKISKNQHKQLLNKYYKFEIRQVKTNESLKSVVELLTNELELDVNSISEIDNDSLNGKSFQVCVPLAQKNLVLNSQKWPKEILIIQCDQ